MSLNRETLSRKISSSSRSLEGDHRFRTMRERLRFHGLVSRILMMCVSLLNSQRNVFNSKYDFNGPLSFPATLMTSCTGLRWKLLSLIILATTLKGPWLVALIVSEGSVGALKENFEGFKGEKRVKKERKSRRKN